MHRSSRVVHGLTCSTPSSQANTTDPQHSNIAATGRPDAIGERSSKPAKPHDPAKSFREVTKFARPLSGLFFSITRTYNSTRMNIGQKQECELHVFFVVMCIGVSEKSGRPRIYMMFWSYPDIIWPLGIY